MPGLENETNQNCVKLIDFDHFCRGSYFHSGLMSDECTAN